MNAITSPITTSSSELSAAGIWPSVPAQEAFFQEILSRPVLADAYHHRELVRETSSELGDPKALFRVALTVVPSQASRIAPRPAAPLPESSKPVVVEKPPVAKPPQEKVVPKVAETESAESEAPSLGWSARLRAGLSKTRGRLASQLSTLFKPGVKIDAELLEDIESELLSADVGIEATDRIMESLQAQVKANQASDVDSLYGELRSEMLRILDVSEEGNPLLADLSHHPFVLLVIGVNGVGKTTTIGKIAKFQRDQGRSVMLAAGDTFRAAAVDQLKTWGQRLDVPVIAQETGADSAAVVFDALNAAKARKADLLIADTAGRLHTQSHLMDELRKVKRVLQKIDPEAPHAVLLVLDAGNGQNALNQAKVFHEAMGISGIALTKLDGTARGGISFAICETLKLPLWFVGVGEQADDLRPFVAEDFVDALLNRQNT